VVVGVKDGQFSLLLPFDTDEPDFIRGFEIGRLWELLKTGGEVNEVIHASNAEMVVRLAEATERIVTTDEPIDADWMEVTFHE
jgi:hypothetical protein